MQKTIILMLACLFSCVVVVHAGSAIIITNNGVPAASLSDEEVQRIFLGKKTAWEDGKKIVPICMKGGRTHASFLRDFLNMNPSQFDVFWKHAIFTGTGRPPKSLVNESEVVQMVKSTSGGIGYIDPDTPHEDMKVLDVKKARLY